MTGLGIEDRTFGPVEGAPMPPRVPPAPAEAPPPLGTEGAPQVVPNAFHPQALAPRPRLRCIITGPRTGRYVAPGGQLHRQSDLVRSKVPKACKDMLSNLG